MIVRSITTRSLHNLCRRLIPTSMIPSPATRSEFRTEVMSRSTSASSRSPASTWKSPARVVSETHLKTGNSLPALTEGSPHLFSMRLSPFSQRVRLVLITKGIGYDEINCNLKEKPEFLVERNPIGKVPVFELNGNVVIESNVICELIEELFPDPPLYPKDPIAKALDKVVMEMYTSKVGKPMTAVVASYGEDKKAFGKLMDGLVALEMELVKRGTPFFGGERPGMVDLVTWPFNERFMAIGQLYDSVKSKLPRLVDYFQRMEVTPAVQATINPKDVHNQFYAGKITQNYKYDFPGTSAKL